MIITRCYFNKKLMCSRSIDREKKELIVIFQGKPEIQESYHFVEIDDFQEPNHINTSYDSAYNESKIFRKWHHEYFEGVTLISKNETANGLYVKFSYNKMIG